ncbi:RagB/SusD family nutrient uptake outer membrane protein [Belliella kenyensis]|uniref:RagB/SusD family nutrient uptake outer membrane protein n=1 Tax=Belliella kenyensis TaxID=1472724 RepID=A0ABV8EP24_9BACT|nr:RagB/SusD family nutrient uptake outer membrane protein [Belliella kenyensis]MCH7401603.1 RagB/SusD family nutrient uptake outer membrane protein [Belliella kenyensis]MDN3603117.1 RagB/SusD family nutrient uptake outer membrane protein [Belliella kenyensis]
MRKNISIKIKSAVAAIALFGATSCEVSDLQPATIIPDNEAFADASRINAAVLGVYEAAQRGFYLGSVQRGYPFGAASTQQGDMRGEDMYNDQLFYEITYTHQYNPNTANNNGQWISLYRMINRANILIENLDPALQNGILTQALRDRYMGEALFLRALAHHELVVYFARPYSDDPSAMGIPYRTFAINDVSKVEPGEQVGRGTVQSVYDQLLADLNLAEQLLPEAGNAYRARKSAAIALKARVKLHMEDFDGVLTEYNKIRTAHAVTANPITPFRDGNSSDNIFSFENSALSNAGVNGALPNMYGNPENGARGLVKISPLIWRSSFWHPQDSRRSIAGASDGLVSQGPLGLYTYKYTDNINFSDPSIIIRFSEVVLSAAEANVRKATPDLAAALSLLNSVRNRALPATVPAFTLADFATPNDLLTAIINETRIEFLAEGRRFPNIHRLAGAGIIPGVPLKATSRSITSINFYTTDIAIPTDYELPYASHLFIWPIPLEEILTNNTAPLPQNPGYQ